jgi:DNA-binding NarL/FixJ family response regulator
MRLLLVDDHAMLRDGLKAILLRAGRQVVAEAASGREALALVERLRPDLVVMDVSMPDLNGVDATLRIKAALPTTKVLALSMHSDRRYVASMLDAGAEGYLLKNAASDELIQAVVALERGGTYLSPALAEATGDHGAKRLTAREREVLQLIAEGKSSKEVANQLGVAVPTVDTYRRQIMDKLHLRTIAELTKYAIREGLTPLE